MVSDLEYGGQQTVAHYSLHRGVVNVRITGEFFPSGVILREIGICPGVGVS